MPELFLEDGQKAGLYDVAEWFQETYPDDIFIHEPVDVIAARKHMKNILKIRDEAARKREEKR